MKVTTPLVLKMKQGRYHNLNDQFYSVFRGLQLLILIILVTCENLPRILWYG